MISEIQNAIAALRGLKGLRNILWTMLLVGLALLVFESLTQYFSVSALQAKAELLTTLNKVETTNENKVVIEELHSKLISETKRVFMLTTNPSLYIADVLIRFFQGFYLSLPLFYFFFKGVIYLIRHATEEIKKNTVMQQMVFFIGSLLFSAAMWFATLLGVASVLWNKSEVLYISWLVFPVSSVVLLVMILAWLASLRILMSGSKKKLETVE